MGRSGGKIVRKLSEVNTRAVSRGLNILTRLFEMAADDVISIKKINKICGLQLPGEPHWSTRLLQLTGR